jgi:hypothetical protein
MEFRIENLMFLFSGAPKIATKEFRACARPFASSPQGKGRSEGLRPKLYAHLSPKISQYPGSSCKLTMGTLLATPGWNYEVV